MYKKMLGYALMDIIKKLKDKEGLEEGEILSQIKDTVSLMEGNLSKDRKVESEKLNGHLLSYLHNFIQETVIDFIDSEKLKFFSLDPKEKQEILNEHFHRGSHLLNFFKEILLLVSLEELNELIDTFYSSFVLDYEKVSVISARDFDKETKKEIRGKFKEGLSFIAFRVDRGLLGGMQIFHKGKLQDLSWLGKINTLANI